MKACTLSWYRLNGAYSYAQNSIYSTKGYILYRILWGFRSPDGLRMLYVLQSKFNQHSNAHSEVVFILLDSHSSQSPSHSSHSLLTIATITLHTLTSHYPYSQFTPLILHTSHLTISHFTHTHNHTSHLTISHPPSHPHRCTHGDVMMKGPWVVPWVTMATSSCLRRLPDSRV